MTRARQQIRVDSHSATPEEAAAIIAAAERFIRDHTPLAASADSEQDNWTRQALLEGVSSRDLTAYSWGERSLWSGVS